VNAFALALLAAAAHPDTNALIEPCKPLLARKAGGEIASIDVDSIRKASQGRLVTGHPAGLHLPMPHPWRPRTRGVGNAALTQMRGTLGIVKSVD
jgi:hypothetical protein